VASPRRVRQALRAVMTQLRAGIRRHLQHRFRGYEMFSKVFNSDRKLASLRIVRGSNSSNRGDELLQRHRREAQQTIAGGMVRADVWAREPCWFYCQSVRCASPHILPCGQTSVAMSIATHLGPSWRFCLLLRCFADRPVDGYENTLVCLALCGPYVADKTAC